MIVSFHDKATEEIYHGINSKEAREIPLKIWDIAIRRLDMLNTAHEVRDLLVPPGNRLELLKGDLKGFYSIRINDQYRILFKRSDGNASAVKITDYH